jgi:hypothetical protein
MQFDRNGVRVRQSQPVRALKRITRVISIDSRDRDPTKYVKVIGGAATSDPGDYVVYLPRPFSNVTRIRLKNAVINAPVGGWTAATDQYVMMGIEGLNRIDETAPGADRAGYADYSFAKILNYNQVTGTTTSNAIFYTDQTYDENVTTYNPPIGTLDRLHITFRRHLPYNSTPTNGIATPLNAPINFGTGENSLTFEIEYLDNVFEDVSSFETFLQSKEGIPHASR